MNLIYFLILARYTAAVLFEKKGASAVHSSRVIYERDAPSPLACAHYCMQHKAEVMFDGRTCKCVMKNEDDNVVDGQHTVTGTLYERKRKRRNPVTALDCDVEVLSVSHPTYPTQKGKYFFFNRKSFRGVRFMFNAKNSRTGTRGQVKIWGDLTNGFEVHGRFNPAQAGQWQVGDILIIMDKSYCTPVTVWDH